MDKQKIKEMLEQYETLQMRAFLCRKADSSSAEAKEAIRVFDLLSACIDSLTEDERKLVKGVYAAGQTISKFSRQMNYSRWTIYRRLDKIIEKIAVCMAVL